MDGIQGIYAFRPSRYQTYSSGRHPIATLEKIRIRIQPSETLGLGYEP